MFFLLSAVGSSRSASSRELRAFILDGHKAGHSARLAVCLAGQVTHFLWAEAGSFLSELAGKDDGEVIVPTS